VRIAMRWASSSFFLGSAWPSKLRIATKTKPAAQVAFAKKAAALKAAAATRLLSRPEVLAIVGVTYPTLWAWMRAGTFPRSRICGGRSMWRSDEIDEWLAELPIRPLKGDAERQQGDEGAVA
jgi:predicted DNA-binding transcriptional regulator AlpA